MEAVEERGKERLWNRNFIKVWTGNFMLFFSFYLIMPLLPLYLRDTFAADKNVIGLVLSGYTLMALMARPFGGFMVDSFPRKRILLICYFAFFIFFAGYFLAWTLLLFAVIRTLHGLPFGAVTVANSTMAIDVLHTSRRAEGIGYYGLSNNLAMAIGPTIAIYLYEVLPDFSYLFALSLLSSGIGFFVVSTVKADKRPEKKGLNALSLDRFFLVKGWRPGVTLACFSFSFGVLSTYLAIYGKEMGIAGGTGPFFMLLALGLIASRLIGSRSLRDGKITKNAGEGMILSLAGYLLFALWSNPIAYYSAAVIIGLGNGHICPAYQTMFINLAPNSKRGTANSTFLTSWDVGVGLGVLAGGVVTEYFSYSSAFLTAALVNGMGVMVFYAVVRKFYNTNKIR